MKAISALRRRYCSILTEKERSYMIDSKLMDVLACPVCIGDLEYNAVAATVTCQQCGLIYPVIDGIPVMIPEKAANFPDLKAKEAE